MILRFPSAALALLWFSISAVPARALPRDVLALTADDGAPNQSFAAAVDVSGSTAIVARRGDGVNGTNSGSAYLFDTSTGSQLFKLLPLDGADSDFFGRSVAIDGGTAIVGAERDDDGAEDSGSAYLFDVTTGAQTFKLTATDGAEDDWFGWSVDVDGTTAVVGAIREQDNGALAGAAYLFDTTTGLQTFKLLPLDGASLAQFGFSVAISGSVVAVAANKEEENGTEAGAVYLFDATTGLQTHKLLASDGVARDEFGTSVAMDGTTLVVGARLDDDNGANSGSAYVFDVTTGMELGKLLAEDGEGNDWFGEVVAIEGSRAIVGCLLEPYAYVFDVATRQQIVKLLDTGAVTGGFGRAVGISGTTAVIGVGSDPNGSALVFRDLSMPTDLNADGTPDVCQPLAFCYGLACPCGNDDPSGGCAHSRGAGGRLTAPGSHSLSAGPLPIQADSLPPGSLALVVVSDVLQPTALLADGRGCLSGPSTFAWRYAPASTGPAGTLSLPDARSGLPTRAFLPGCAYFFQVWFRDVFCSDVPVPCASPCGSGSNFTHVAGVRILP